MSDLNTECPYCESENAYHNGTEFECPDCGRTWEDDYTVEGEED